MHKNIVWLFKKQHLSSQFMNKNELKFGFKSYLLHNHHILIKQHFKILKIVYNNLK